MRFRLPPTLQSQQEITMAHDTAKDTAGSAKFGGGVGGALGVLTVLFLPPTVYQFTAESAAVATAAFGILFSFGMQYVPKPGG